MIKELLSEEIQAYINEHLNDDVADLSLRSELRHLSFFKEILEQIKSKKKAKSKLPTWFEKEGIVFPPSISMEQCSSELTAEYKARLISGQKLVDLTGGFGIDSYYLSQNFEETDYVERNEKLCEICHHNFTVLDANVRVNKQIAEEFLERGEHFDWIYLDPARRDDVNNKVFRLEDCTPDVITLQDELLKNSEHILIKLSPMLDIKQGLLQLRHVSEVHVIAVRNEVKELLFTIKKGFEGVAQIHCINLNQNAKSEFTFTLSEEEFTESKFSEIQGYLYEPNAAIMKAGAFKSIANRFELKKINQHTHLYTSEELIEEFPGRSFKVIEELPLNKKLKSSFPDMKANITVRNYPLSVQQLRNKTGIKEGGEHYIFAFTGIKQKHFLLTEKIY